MRSSTVGSFKGGGAGERNADDDDDVLVVSGRESTDAAALVEWVGVLGSEVDADRP